MSDEVLLERRGRLAVITLNRPKALNALTLGMVEALDAALDQWERDDGVEVVAITGAGGRAFAAGGDIVRLHEAGRAGEPYASTFFRREYALNRRIYRYAKPFVAFIDGIVMGGGVGVSVHGDFRVATSATRFAMPETGIGFFPDVGGTWFLPRLPHRLGWYLALTGARLDGADCMAAGIATHFMESDAIDTVLARLAGDGQAEPLDRDAIGLILDEATAPAPDASISGKFDDIARLFAADDLTAIVTTLEGEKGELGSKVLADLATKSPTSLAVACAQLAQGVTLDFEGCMTLEYRISQAMMRDSDFFEGVRALLIDKDNRPAWSPARIADLRGGEAAAMMTPPADGDLTF